MWEMLMAMGAGKFRPQKKLGRILPEKNNGIGASTVLSRDMGWETALLDLTGAHPVERYETEKRAEAGHRKWVRFAKNANGKTVFQLETDGSKLKIKLRKCGKKDYIEL